MGARCCRFMSNEEVLDIIHKHCENGDAPHPGNMESACKELQQTSKALWMKEEQVVDDTTMVVLSFKI